MKTENLYIQFYTVFSLKKTAFLGLEKLYIQHKTVFLATLPQDCIQIPAKIPAKMGLFRPETNFFKKFLKTVLPDFYK